MLSLAPTFAMSQYASALHACIHANTQEYALETHTWVIRIYAYTVHARTHAHTHEPVDC